MLSTLTSLLYAFLLKNGLHDLHVRAPKFRAKTEKFV